MTRYTETQHLDRQALVTSLVFASLAEFIAIVAIILESSNHPNPPGFPAIPIAIIVITGALIPLLLMSIRLIIEVHDDGIYYRLAPFGPFRRIAFTDIAQAELIEYNPLRDFGGWGKKRRLWGKFKGTCYTMGGTRALAITLTNGKRIFIGTHQPEELLNAVYATTERR